MIALGPLLAPKLSAPGALERAIEEDRARGPARPSRRLLRRIAFGEEVRRGCVVFRAAPRSGVKSPLRLLYLHGGAYVFDLKAVQWNLVEALISRLGAETVIPIYPLAPEHNWNDGLDAVERVYSDLIAEIAAKRLVIFGDSAGGGLALALAHRLRDRQAPAPAALVLFSPWLDLGVAGPDQNEIRDPFLSIDFLRRCGRLWAKDLPVDDPRVSPLFGDHGDLPPTILFSGTRDILDSDARRLATANSEADFRHYPEMTHVWPCAPTPEARQALDEAAQFIRRHTLC